MIGVVVDAAFADDMSAGVVADVSVTVVAGASVAVVVVGENVSVDGCGDVVLVCVNVFVVVECDKIFDGQQSFSDFRSYHLGIFLNDFLFLDLQIF